MRMINLRLSETIRNEWRVRCIGDVIPSLEGVCWDKPIASVTETTAREILADCEFYADPKAVDATPGERAAYRALARQIQSHYKA